MFTLAVIGLAVVAKLATSARVLAAAGGEETHLQLWNESGTNSNGTTGNDTQGTAENGG